MFEDDDYEFRASEFELLKYEKLHIRQRYSEH